jgi:hypothetical protein
MTGRRSESARANRRPGRPALVLGLTAALSAGWLAGCRSNGELSGLNTLTSAERRSGWILLFNGRNLKGWQGLPGGAFPGHWRARRGALTNVSAEPGPGPDRGEPRPAGDLQTEAVFDDFELSFEWKIGPSGNSGLKYNVSDEVSRRYGPELSGRGGAVGFEYQILDNVRSPDARVGPHRAAASLYDLLPAVGGVCRAVGEYNTARVVFRGDHGEHWLNGVKVVDYDLGSPVFASGLAASKFRSTTGFADKRRGHIALQDHGTPVWFRNIKLRPIRDVPAPASAPAP